MPDKAIHTIELGDHFEWRQIGIVDRHGRSAIPTAAASVRNSLPV